MPGEQEGNALVDVLFGDVNPSGKMPHTMPNVFNEMQMTGRQYPGIPPASTSAGLPPCQDKPTPMEPTGLNPSGGTGFAPCAPTKAYYDEKLLVGYRWYDEHRVAPAYAFGHGLSYTTFHYANLKVTLGAGLLATVSLTVTNNGTVAGSETAQLYLSFPEAAGEPPQQLKAFRKAGPLQPGATATVIMALTAREFSIWSVVRDASHCQAPCPSVVPMPVHRRTAAGSALLPPRPPVCSSSSYNYFVSALKGLLNWLH